MTNEELGESENREVDENGEVSPKRISLKVDLPPETAQGLYSNLTMSNFNEEEFVLDFAYIQPSLPQGRIHSRIILSPKNTKRLMQMLQQNILDYEKKVGPIDEDSFPRQINLSFN